MRFLPRIPRLVEVGVAVVIVGVLCGLVLPSGDWDFSHRFPPAVPNVGNGFADVAGEYHQGASRGRNWRLSLLQDGRYSFVWSGCLGVYHRESGFLRRVGDDVVLSPIKPIEPEMVRTFRPLKWGRRTYLLPPEQIEEFCDAIIRGAEPRNEVAGRFYLHGHQVKAAGITELPKE